MDNADAMRKASEYARRVRDLMGYQEAVLFGSYAHGTAREESDIDVGLFLDEWDVNESYLDLLVQLYGLAEEVDVRIEPHLFIRSEDRSGFGAEVEKTGILLT